MEGRQRKLPDQQVFEKKQWQGRATRIPRSGLVQSYVCGGLAIAIPHKPGVPYNYDSNLAPTVGGRFVF
jgi:hypothetical protein